jgi:hypothetical protein
MEPDDKSSNDVSRLSGEIKHVNAERMLVIEKLF